MSNLNLLLLLMMTLVIASCSPTYYIPNPQNVPLISQQGESSFTLALATRQINLQGGYGISKKFAVKANGYLTTEKSSNTNIVESSKLIEIGAGYFKALPNKFVFEAYGIAGIGSIKNQYNYPSEQAPNYSNGIGQLTANTFRFGIEPTIGYKSKNFSAAFSTRFVNLKFSDIKGDLIYKSENQINYLKANASNSLFEPVLTLRAGAEYVKLQLQHGYSFNLSNRDFRQNSGFFSIGINVNLK